MVSFIDGAEHMPCRRIVTRVQRKVKEHTSVERSNRLQLKESTLALVEHNINSMLVRLDKMPRLRCHPPKEYNRVPRVNAKANNDGEFQASVSVFLPCTNHARPRRQNQPWHHASSSSHVSNPPQPHLNRTRVLARGVLEATLCEVTQWIAPFSREACFGHAVLYQLAAMYRIQTPLPLPLPLPRGHQPPLLHTNSQGNHLTTSCVIRVASDVS